MSIPFLTISDKYKNGLLLSYYTYDDSIFNIWYDRLDNGNCMDRATFSAQKRFFADGTDFFVDVSYLWRSGIIRAVVSFVSRTSASGERRDIYVVYLHGRICFWLGITKNSGRLSLGL